MKYTYDEKGNLISKTKYQYVDDWKGEYSEGQIIIKENFEYDEFNRIKRRLIYSERGELIVTNNFSYIGDSIIVEDGFGTDITDELVYQSVLTRSDNPAVKVYSTQPYWKFTRKKSNQEIRIVLSESRLESDNKIIEYHYDHFGKLKEKNEISGFNKPQDINLIESTNLTWRDFKVVEDQTESEFKTPDITEAWVLLTKPCNGKVIQSDYYEYYEFDSLKSHLKDIGNTKILIKYSYPDKLTEIREYSGSPSDSDNGKAVHIYDKLHRPKSIEIFNVMGEPTEFKEYVYSK